MKMIFLVAFLALPMAATAQTTQKPGASRPAPQYGEGGSPHCDRLTGTEKDQCLKDEGAKTDSKASADAPAAGASAAPKRGPAPGGANVAEHAPTK
jgi:hypothetical protein